MDRAGGWLGLLWLLLLLTTATMLLLLLLASKSLAEDVTMLPFGSVLLVEETLLAYKPIIVRPEGAVGICNPGYVEGAARRKQIQVII